jgi:hypothetical protein
MKTIQEVAAAFKALNPKAKVNISGNLLTARQGDVFAIWHAQAPEGLVKQERDAQGRAILALGEMTGHAHAIEVETAEVFVNPKDGTKWLIATDAAPQVHEEHDVIVWPPDTVWAMPIQRRLSLASRKSVQVFD